MYAIYELEPIGLDGALEANGRVHFYCSDNHAKQAITEHFDSANYSQPVLLLAEDFLPGTQCEACGEAR
jgi:hypothetical protein